MLYTSRMTRPVSGSGLFFVDRLFMQNHLRQLLQHYQAHDAQEQAFLLQTREFVDNHVACCQRDCAVGHITASAWVLAPDRQSVLLTHHKKLNRWLQLGGHLEDDCSVQAAALREAHEESGLDGLTLLSSDLFDLDVHTIPARGAEAQHLHFDLRFLMQARQREFVLSDESHQLAWVSLASLQAQMLDASLKRMLDKTLAWDFSRSQCAAAD